MSASLRSTRGPSTVRATNVAMRSSSFVLACLLPDAQLYPNAVGVVDEHGDAVPPLHGSADDAQPGLAELGHEVVHRFRVHVQAVVVYTGAVLRVVRDETRLVEHVELLLTDAQDGRADAVRIGTGRAQERETQRLIEVERLVHVGDGERDVMQGLGSQHARISSGRRPSRPPAIGWPESLQGSQPERPRGDSSDAKQILARPGILRKTGADLLRRAGIDDEENGSPHEPRAPRATA